MIIYDQEHQAYKYMSNIDLNFNHNQSLKPHRRLRTIKKLTHQNKQFLKSIGLKLKKQ